jgi:hypothetical protein
MQRPKAVDRVSLALFLNTWLRFRGLCGLSVAGEIFELAIFVRGRHRDLVGSTLGTNKILLEDVAV